MNSLGAPSPNGFHVIFYQNNWSIVGHDVCNFVREFNTSLKEVNYKFITLIPKVKNAERIGDFISISSCNVLYKIVAKILANRLKLIHPTIISLQKSAFVPGRLITDNMLIAYEVLYSLTTSLKGKERFMVLKLYMSKAYDRIEWSFLETVMTKLGFHPRWIRWITECVLLRSSSKYGEQYKIWGYNRSGSILF